MGIICGFKVTSESVRTKEDSNCVLKRSTVVGMNERDLELITDHIHNT